MNNETRKERLYKWLASWFPRDLVTAVIIRAFTSVGEPAGNGQYHDMPISLLFQRWEGRERERWFYWHWQHLGKERGWPAWRHGRAWCRFFQDWLELRAEWNFFGDSSTAIGFDFAGEEEDFQIHVAINRLFSVWLTIERFAPLRKFFRPFSKGYGYETSVKWFDGSLWVHFAYNEMWGARTFKRWWIPGWVSVWQAAGYKDDPGVGFYISFHFDSLLLGSRQHEKIELWPEPIQAEIPIEPDNSLGFHYTGTFKAERHSWWRKHFPWFKTVHNYVDIRLENPPMHQGKGENGWDMDDDGIFGMGVPGTTLEEAIVGYQKAVERDRKRYGMGSDVLKAQEKLSEINQSV